MKTQVEDRLFLAKRDRLARLARVVVVVLAFAGSSASAFDFVDIHALGSGNTVVLSQASPGALVNTPGGIMNGGVRFELGYTRKYDLADLDRAHAAISGKKGAVTLALGVSQFGKSSLYAERTAKGMIAMERGKFTFGLTGSVFQVQFGNNYGRFSAATIGCGLGVRTRQLLGVITADNLTRPQLYGGAAPYPRSGALNLEWLTRKKLSLMVRAVITENERPRTGLGQRIPLATASALYWGVSTSPLEYGGGLDVNARSLIFTYAFSIHPVLGFSQAVSVSLGNRKKQPVGPDSMEGDF